MSHSGPPNHARTCSRCSTSERIVVSAGPAAARARTNPASTSVSNAASSSGPAGTRASRRSRTTARLNPSSLVDEIDDLQLPPAQPDGLPSPLLRDRQRAYSAHERSRDSWRTRQLIPGDSLDRRGQLADRAVTGDVAGDGSFRISDYLRLGLIDAQYNYTSAGIGFQEGGKCWHADH